MPRFFKRCTSLLLSLLLLFYSLRVFHTSVSWVSFTGVWVTTKYLQVFRILLSIRADLNNTWWSGWSRFVLRFLSLPFHFPSLWIVPSVPVTNGITVTLIFLSLQNFLARSTYQFFPLSWIFTSGFDETSKPTTRRLCVCVCVFFFGGVITWCGLLVRIRRVGFFFLKIPKNFMRIILYDGFWFLHISLSGW